MTCKDCVYATQPTTTMRCRNHGINMSDNAVVCNEFKGKPQTNGDRLRSMSNEELADFINSIFYGFHENPGMCDVCDRDSIQNCKDCWLDWLKGKVTE